jgi:AcrR family transcriptional regulator
MTPYPAQIHRDTLVQTARQIIETEGLDRLSLGRLAQALGVKAPSLYHHVQNKTDLLLAVNTLTLLDLVGAMQTAIAAASHDPRDRLRAMANAYRAYAHAHPVAYSLLYSSTEPALYPDAQLSEALALPLQELMAALTGPEAALDALRGAWALLHGFVTLELSGQFRRGGSLEESWARSLEAYLAGWER